MQMGADIKEVFTRFANATAKVEEVVKKCSCRRDWKEFMHMNEGSPKVTLIDEKRVTLIDEKSLP